ncbi:MAG: cation:proton antiporter [Chitinivibrionales bacterium]|nr:cation:proton antiporter [Chitinivibrionales bacterium]
MPFFNTIIIIFGLSIAVLLLCSRLRLPAIVGLLITGILAGPYGLRLISATADVQTAADIGIVLLLFTIGTEFSLRSFWRMRGIILRGGLLQIGLTLAVTALMVWWAGHSLRSALFLGCIVSLSSTAIVFKVLFDKAEAESPHGRIVCGILVFQDLAIVPMMLAIPLLNGAAAGRIMPLAVQSGKGLIIFALLAAAIRWLAPRLFYRVARTRNRELFLLFTIVLCFSVAWLSQRLGLSLALGAFLAGLIIAESDYSLQAQSIIAPLRDIFTCFFFISIGMLLPLNLFFAGAARSILLTIATMAGKALIAALVAGMLGLPLRTMILTGFSLASIGEFSFILSRSGLSSGLLSLDLYQQCLTVTVLTMALTPLMIKTGELLSRWSAVLPLPQRLKSGLKGGKNGESAAAETIHSDHLVIVGFGISGRNLADAARLAKIPYVIIEMNPQTVRREKAAGQPIFFGDATAEVVLRHAGLLRARVAAVVVSDPAATRMITASVRKLNASIHLIARTRFSTGMDDLYNLGASEVVCEEFETSVEVFTRVMMNYLVPSETIAQFTASVREDGYRVLRNALYRSLTPVLDLGRSLSDFTIHTLALKAGDAIAGETIAQLDVRKVFGVTVLAVRRGGEFFANPGADFAPREGDHLMLLGKTADIARMSAALLKHAEPKV